VTTVAGVPLVCPGCKGGLVRSAEVLHCAPCAKDYPVVAGIPDLRLEPDPWIGMADDREKALRVLREAEGLDFEGHVRSYWKLTPTTAAPQADRFVNHVMGADRRSSEWLDVHRESTFVSGDGPWLDEGCGTADLAAVAPPDARVIGIDVAMRWLVVARQRLQDLGRPANLVCANAEHLPFPDGAFGRVFSLGLMEHCFDLGALSREAWRVLEPGGRFRARTVNRFTLLREPHVGVWGVGFLPRSWAGRFVGWRSGHSYEHHHPWSAAELRHEFGRAGFSGLEVLPAITLRSEVDHAGPLLRLATPVYEVVRQTSGVRALAGLVAPLLEVGGIRDDHSRDSDSLTN
jgi:SAM-dependent methyltransferase